MKEWLRSHKLTRPQKIARNILLIFLIAAILFLHHISGYSHSEEDALSEALWRMGVSEDTVFLRHGWKYEEQDMWSEYFLRSNDSIWPVVVNIKIYREGPFRYYADYPAVSYDVENDRGIRSGGRITFGRDDRYIDTLSFEDGEHIYFGNIFDFPQLGSDNVMKLTNMENDCWLVEVDCLGKIPDSWSVQSTMEIDPLLTEVFEPELSYVVDGRVDTVSWKQVDERCAERGMTLTDEEAYELTRRLLKYYNQKLQPAD